MHRVEGIHVRRKEVACGFVPQDAKAIIDSGVAPKGFNVDLEKNRADSARQEDANLVGQKMERLKSKSHHNFA